MLDAKQLTSEECEERWNYQHVAGQEARQLQTELVESVGDLEHEGYYSKVSVIWPRSKSLKL